MPHRTIVRAITAATAATAIAALAGACSPGDQNILWWNSTTGQPNTQVTTWLNARPGSIQAIENLSTVKAYMLAHNIDRAAGLAGFETVSAGGTNSTPAGVLFLSHDQQVIAYVKANN